jgi:hypothetical protein
MQDSFEITLFGKAQEDLHTPYVAGAKFDINIATTDYPDTTGWGLKSSDPSVLSIDVRSANLDFQVTAVGTGHATLTVVDANGRVLDQHDVEVAQPDSVQLAAHGLLLAGLSDSAAQVTQASVVAGGTATFLVRYYKGSQELYGNGAVTTTSTGAVTAVTTTSSFTDARDWVEVDATQQTGQGQVALAVGGRTVATIPASVVPATQIASVATLAESDANANDRDVLYVFARAFDGQGVDIYGASFSWETGGTAPRPLAPGSGPTDVLRYTFKSSSSETVTASLDALSSSTTVHGVGGTLDSTADTGCSVGRTPGAELAPGGALVVVLAAGTFARGRRRGLTR